MNLYLNYLNYRLDRFSLFLSSYGKSVLWNNLSKDSCRPCKLRFSKGENLCKGYQT